MIAKTIIGIIAVAIIIQCNIYTIRPATLKSQAQEYARSKQLPLPQLST